MAQTIVGEAALVARSLRKAAQLGEVLVSAEARDRAGSQQLAPGPMIEVAGAAMAERPSFRLAHGSAAAT
jgi:class 3 adenylate cyclase